MSPPIIQTANHIASVIGTAALMVVVAAVVAYVAARTFGAESRARRQLIFLLVGAVGLMAAATYSSFRLRG